MKDKRGTTLTEGCILQKDIHTDGPQLIYDGDRALVFQKSSGGLAGGTVPIEAPITREAFQEFLLDSHWIVIKTPTLKEKKV